RALACRFRRLAENSLAYQGVLGEAPNAAREARALPGRPHDERTSIRETSRASPRESVAARCGSRSRCGCGRRPNTSEARVLWAAGGETAGLDLGGSALLFLWWHRRDVGSDRVRRGPVS